jgi:hypothetical protein
MARPRLPLEKARLTGAYAKNPARYKGRSASHPEPLGPPPEWLGKEAQAAWKSFDKELPWLRQSHRCLVEIAATLRGRIARGGDVGVHALRLLRQCLNSMGGSPVDQNKIQMAEEPEVDPADRYFQ